MSFFIDCLIFYGVDLKQWPICSMFAYGSTMEILSCSRFDTLMPR